jgi:hypothetical protein
MKYQQSAAGMLVHKKLKDQKRKIYVVVSFSTEIVFLEHLTDRV